MPDLNFQVEGAEMVPYAASPLLAFHLCITNADTIEAIQSVMLTCQVRIEPPRRKYSAEDEVRLRDLFGERSRWGETLKSMLWTFASINVRSFIGETRVDLPVPCTYDFNIAATKYFYALEDGDVPLTLLFSGTVFYETAEGLRIAQIPWEKEATYRLPVRVWQELMEHYYPNNAWLNLRKDVFDQLYRYKIERGLPTWEQTVESLLAATGAKVAP